jgi:PadR family transcriptional regulator, regulatory protein AphA
LKLEYFILGLLKLKPRTGYDLKSFFDHDGRFMRPSTPLSQIYTTLKSMTSKGWLEFLEEQREGKPDLKIYSVTASGFHVLKEWLEKPYEPSFRFQDREFLGLLFFSCFIDLDQVLQHCYTELNYRKEQIAKFRPRDRTAVVDASAGVSQKEIQFLYDWLDQYGRGSIDQYVAWLEEFTHQLEIKKTESQK